jgi:hypothetical protein
MVSCGFKGILSTCSALILYSRQPGAMPTAQLGAIQPGTAIEYKLRHQGANLYASNTQA